MKTLHLSLFSMIISYLIYMGGLFCKRSLYLCLSSMLSLFGAFGQECHKTGTEIVLLFDNNLKRACVITASY